MTLVVALACKDGIVFASDSQATQMPLIKRIVEKIYPIASNVLMAGAGSISQIQKITDYSKTMPIEIRAADFDTIKDFIKKGAHMIRANTLKHYRLLDYDDNEIRSSASEIILCGFRDGKPIICHLDSDAMDTDFDDYCTIGYGVPFAQVVLKNHRVKSYNMDAALCLAYKVIKEAIETGAYSMDYPIRMWTMSISVEDSVSIEELSDAKIEAITDYVNALSIVDAENFAQLSLKNNLQKGKRKENSTGNKKKK